MTWFRVDDSFPQHPKVLSIPRKDRTAAIGLWTIAGTWCAAQLTDGALGAHMVEELAGTKRAADLLVSVGLWEKTDDGYQIHDYLDYNPSAEEVRADQAAKHEAKAKAGRLGGIASGVARRKHGRSKDEAGAKQNDSTDETNGKQNEAPTRPDPTSSSNEEEGRREDVEALCNHLYRRVVDNGSKAAITAKWREAARLLIDRDKRPLAEAHALIDWCQKDTFWMSNIRSLPKFRDQYDTLRLQAQSRGLRLVTDANGQRDWTKDELDDVLGPDMWRLPPFPPGLTGDQMWEWEQRIKREHRAERVAAAEAKIGGAA